MARIIYAKTILKIFRVQLKYSTWIILKKALGLIPSSRESIRYMLNRPDGGNCVALVVGGAPESLFSRRGNVIELFLQKRFDNRFKGRWPAERKVKDTLASDSWRLAILFGNFRYQGIRKKGVPSCSTGQKVFVPMSGNPITSSHIT